MDTLKKILFSNRLTGVLFIAFAVAMAIGTFMDAGQETSPTPLTRNLIYNAWWFEAIMLLFVINFIGNIFKYNLLNKRKWPVLVLHLSWVFILLGAFVTRYISYEGVMSIREGATESSFLSEKTYLTVYIDDDYEIDGLPQRWYTERPVDFSPRMENKFSFNGSSNELSVSGSGVTIGAATFKLDTDNFDVDSSAGELKLGPTPNISGGNGVFMSSSGEFRMGDDDGHIRFEDGSFHITGSDLNIGITQLNISSSGFTVSSPEKSMSLGDDRELLMDGDGGTGGAPIIKLDGGEISSSKL